jgi:hypothetical protein
MLRHEPAHLSRRSLELRTARQAIILLITERIPPALRGRRRWEFPESRAARWRWMGFVFFHFCDHTGGSDHWQPTRWHRDYANLVLRLCQSPLPAYGRENAKGHRRTPPGLIVVMYVMRVMDQMSISGSDGSSHRIGPGHIDRESGEDRAFGEFGDYVRKVACF